MQLPTMKRFTSCGHNLLYNSKWLPGSHKISLLRLEGLRALLGRRDALMLGMRAGSAQTEVLWARETAL